MPLVDQATIKAASESAYKDIPCPCLGPDAEIRVRFLEPAARLKLGVRINAITKQTGKLDLQTMDDADREFVLDTFRKLALELVVGSDGKPLFSNARDLNVLDYETLSEIAMVAMRADGDDLADAVAEKKS